MALQAGEFEMAKSFASKSYIDPKLKKSLWLKIAKKILKVDDPDRMKQSEDSVKKVMELIQEQKNAVANDSDAENLLKIDDLLQYLGNIKVELLKDELCRSLDDYDQQINVLKKELKEQSVNADMLREKNRKAKNKFITVHPTQSCELCFHELLSKAFYVFHCGHGYH